MMNITNNELVTVLNDLIETCKDGEEGFKTCAVDIKNPQIKSMFLARSQECSLAARELQELVRTRGGEPETKSSVSGTLHRSWVDLKAAIMGHDDESVLNECERGEDVAVKSYADAVKKDLPAEIRVVVERQYQGVLKNHNEVKSLRDQIVGKTPA